MRLSPIAIASLLFVVGCGGPPPPPAPTRAASAEPVDAGPSSRSNEAAVASAQKEFGESCTKKLGRSETYCTCAWEALRKVIDADLIVSGEIPAAKGVQIRAQTTRDCSSKLTEAEIRREFDASCTHETEGLGDYCECTWTGFRKVFSLGDFSDEAVLASERFNTTRQSVLKECGDKVPEKVAKDAVLKACVDPAHTEAQCQCVFKELDKILTYGEIEQGAFDQPKVVPELLKRCEKPTKK